MTWLSTTRRTSDVPCPAPPAAGDGLLGPPDGRLEATINATPCDAVIVGTPVDLRRILTLPVPAVRVFSDIEEIGEPTLAALVPRLAQKIRAQHCSP